MMNRRMNESVCRGRMTRRQDPLWGAYGTYPQRNTPRCGEDRRQGCVSPREDAVCRREDTVFPREGAACRLQREEQRSRGNGCGCGCHHHDHNHHHDHDHDHDHDHAHDRDNCGCNKLLRQIRAVDFALYEVVLYLDVYPTSCEALDTYHKLVARRKALCQEYQAACGPLTSTGNESRTSWDWIEKPFPWEASAN